MSILFYDAKQCHIPEDKKSAGRSNSFTFLWKCFSLESHFFKDCAQIYLGDVLTQFYADSYNCHHLIFQPFKKDVRVVAKI